MKMLNHDYPDNRIFVHGWRVFFVLIVAMAGFVSVLRAQDTHSPVGVAPDVTPQNQVPTAPISASLDSMEELNDRSKLSNGDTVSYRVIEEQKDPVILTVSDSGELNVPLVGIVTAKGKTCKELANELKPKLEKEYFYHATVIIGLETFSSHPLGKVYLTGQVQHQGAIEIPSNETITVSKAVLLSGGLADFADRRKVKLVRKKPDGTTETTVVDLVEILDKGHSERDPVVQPDDTIVVPQRLINF
jgi:polysaccharide export outer membrane protein